ncbi:MAG: phenylacetate--CoA ligase [Rhodospirillaceae bacterium]|nr:phenylacetate--CoA ligase [Rhodospirillaceae bacterium]
MAGDTHDGYMFDRPAETMPRGDLQTLQLEKLKLMVAHAYANVDHYKAAWDSAGIKPGDLEHMEDFQRFPFTVKDDLRDAYPFNMFAVPREQITRIHASSGTTGKPTVVGYTAGDLDTWTDVMARTIACGGGRPGDLMHNAYGYSLFTGAFGYHYGAERLGCTVIPVSGGMSERQITLLRDFGPSLLGATPSYALSLIETAKKMDVDLASLPIKHAFFGAEPWTDEMRAVLDASWGMTSIDTYGLSEIIGPGVAAECLEARDGLHGWEDLFLFEIINPDTGDVLPMGGTGELVITTLSKWAQPMIRYRTRDITQLTDEPCTCGRTHLRILRLAGRSDDMLIIRGVNLFPSQIESVLVGMDGIAPHYQLVVQRDGAMDTLSVEAEALEGVEPHDYDGLAAGVSKRIKETIGVSARTIVLAPGEVPRSEGKAVRVRDLRPK